ncbi:MAG: hypothetical protein M2R45_00523 [Verrucomicrobia subdivision 3 bacterium]|nr:hypothetical protein [Limisphaerales bacterium]MCS1413599.1 hypothetical protein [Limisphaerales bacterium]
MGGLATLEFSREGNILAIRFTGMLFSANTVDGTYSPVAGAQSSLTVDLSSTSRSKFYRAQ